MRANVGIPPYVIADQHLIAEYRELPMIIGQLKQNDWLIKSPVPDVFQMGIGYMNWFKPRLLYLKRRHLDVIHEMSLRNFKCDYMKVDLSEAPDHLKGDWIPTMEHSLILRERIRERLLLKPHFYKFRRQPIQNINDFIAVMDSSELWSS